MVKSSKLEKAGYAEYGYCKQVAEGTFDLPVGDLGRSVTGMASWRA